MGFLNNILLFFTKPYYFIKNKLYFIYVYFKFIYTQRTSVVTINNNLNFTDSTSKKFLFKIIGFLLFLIFLLYVSTTHFFLEFLDWFLLAWSRIDFIFSYLKNLFNFYTGCITFFYTGLKNVLDYFISLSYFLIFITFFLYFFNVFILTITTYLIGVRGVFIISFISIFFFWLSQIVYLKDFFFNSTTFYLNFDFITPFLGSANFSFSLKIDFLNYSFLFLTTTIGLAAIVYSLSYFKNEPNTDRFIILINWFILSMSFLVVSDNAILLFLGWELIGLTSFLLINFWTLRRGTLKAAIKAFTFNKLSDVFLLFFIIVMAHQSNSLNLLDWQNFLISTSFLDFNFALVPGVFLILASSIKSAQFIGHLWLPDSMEAPIPASALIHSATLVSAGVFLLLKFNILINLPILTYIIFFLGAITSFYGSIVSAAQTDCKKLLAYSTISHCGFLFITISINNVYLSVTYLYLHGFFKALTFFCVGNLVKVSKGYQDTRKMGQLFVALPIESILLIFCAVNLGALPFTVGYFYKYLFQGFFLNEDLMLFLFPLLLISMLASVVYVYRLVFYSLFDIQKGNEKIFISNFYVIYNKYSHSNSTFLGFLFIFLLCVFSFFVLNLYILYFREFLIYNLNCDYKVSAIKFMFTPININYLLFFYASFITMVFVLISYECRKVFDDVQKRNHSFYIFYVLSIWQLILLVISNLLT